MLKENILDSETLENEANQLLTMISWWEKKRVIYNINLIGIQILMISFYWKGALEYGIGNTIFESLAYTVAANLFYSLGWGTSVLIYYYNLKFLQRITTYRMLFFVGGILFSIMLTFTWFRETLL